MQTKAWQDKKITTAWLPRQNQGTTQYYMQNKAVLCATAIPLEKNITGCVEPVLSFITDCSL